MFVPMANVLVEGSTFEIRKIDVSKRHLLRAVSTPPYPLPKKQLLSGRRTNKRRTDFGQSNFALSNVRALRAIMIKRSQNFRLRRAKQTTDREIHCLKIVSGKIVHMAKSRKKTLLRHSGEGIRSSSGSI